MQVGRHRERKMQKRWAGDFAHPHWDHRCNQMGLLRLLSQSHHSTGCFTSCCHQTTSPPPRSLWVPSLLILLIFLSSPIFLVSRQHALAAPSLNIPINAHHPQLPPHCLHGKAYPRHSLSLGLHCPFFLKPSRSPPSMSPPSTSPMISLLRSS